MAIRLGIIGCGEVVAQGHAPALREASDITVVGLADPSPDRTGIVAAALGADVPGFADYRQLLAQCELDAVLLATPSRLREEIIADLAAAGVFIVCEKPLALTLAGADAILAACQAAGVGLAVCHSWAYFAEYLTMRQLIRDGAVGTLHTVSFSGLSANPWAGAATWHPGWRDDPAIAGGGRFLDSGLHSLYLMEMMFGEQAESVSAEVQFDPDVAVEARCFSRFSFPAGVGLVNVGRGQGPAHASATGTDGRIQIVHPVEAGDLGAQPERVVVVRDGRVTESVPVPPRVMCTPAFYAAVTRAVRGEPAAPLTGTAGRRAVELVMGAYAAGARGEPVRFPLAPDDPVYQRGADALW
ncbi:MAG TPA: Gfo/Idh/MocA family oxidoreductase [Streptosporangiaceae bacterium]|nr:Gfo/Idh/MocA family oxidoreductase [Streptosporangiaceae bacterium]